MANDNSASVYTQVRRQAFYVFGVAQNKRSQFRKLGYTSLTSTECFADTCWQPKNFTQFMDASAVLKSTVSTKPSGVRIAFKDIPNDVVAVFPREIDVEIRWVFAIQVDEALKIEIEF